MDRARALRLLVVGCQILGVAAAWYATGKFGLMFLGTGHGVRPWWPAAGVALVGLLLFGPIVTPGIFVGAFPIEATIPGVPLASALLTTVGVTLAPLCGYFLLRRVGFRIELDRIRDALALVLLAAFAATTISATFAVGARVIFGGIPFSLASWLTWWTGDVMGVISVTPFLLSLRNRRWRDRPLRRSQWIEILALVIGSFVVVLLATKTIGTLYVAFVFVGWAAWRFRLVGASSCSLLASPNARWHPDAKAMIVSEDQRLVSSTTRRERYSGAGRVRLPHLTRGQPTVMPRRLAAIRSYTPDLRARASTSPGSRLHALTASDSKAADGERAFPAYDAVSRCGCEVIRRHCHLGGRRRPGRTGPTNTTPWRSSRLAP
ncbi:MASE1 domain-containing protein [Actinopolymorpha singaporensis]|uniref:MASE1 protein n=1 Tax=Actinopolymorpha singaporensis TaxID=117157 RepID=A0A1H1Q3H3_9ACTN|nr:MASE1 domain-containing protein [Actinopolymorpha singaporensis]SDS18071.1 MASE1 protein [Actinopolymorpha singaporensis]